MTILEYVDYHASRWTAEPSRRRISELHQLRGIAQILLWTEEFKAKGYAWKDGKWVKAGAALLLILALYPAELSLQVPGPTKAPVCIEYCGGGR